MTKRVLIAVGGTGGHIYPAIALATKLKEKNPGIYIMFAGGGLEENRFFDKQSYPYSEVACGYFPIRKPLTLLKSLGKVASGVWKSDRIIKDFKPQIVIGFGSHHSLPILIAAKLHGIPIVLHEANAVPGKVNKLLAKYAKTTGIQIPDAADYLRGNTITVQPPLREGMAKGMIAREVAYSHYQLDPSRKTLLVFGGSQGANKINKLLSEAVEYFRSSVNGMQILHFTGHDNETKSLEEQYCKAGIKAFVGSYEDQMQRAWEIADLAVGRSGAGTIAEAIEFEVPVILIPYPYATDDHQTVNARYMTNSVGGGVYYSEEMLTPELLADEVRLYFEKEPQRLQGLKTSIREYKKNYTQHDMCSLIAEHIP